MASLASLGIRRSEKSQPGFGMVENRAGAKPGGHPHPFAVKTRTRRRRRNSTNC